MNAVNWVLIDSTQGATTQDGSKLSPDVLNHIAEAVQDQVNQEFASEWGAKAAIRAGTSEEDIQPGEWAYGIVSSLPGAPGASAYHDINGQGVPFAPIDDKRGSPLLRRRTGMRQTSSWYRNGPLSLVDRDNGCRKKRTSVGGTRRLAVDRSDGSGDQIPGVGGSKLNFVMYRRQSALTR